MKLNSEFVSNISDIYGELGKTWLKDLPIHIERICIQWNVQFVKPIPDLSYNFVGIVKIHSGVDAILKMAPVKEHIASEAHWLHCFTSGVATLYEYNELENAILMEQLKPGQSLKSLVKEGKDDDATRIICRTIKNIQSHQIESFAFKHLSEMAYGFDLLIGHIDERLISKAKTLFHEHTNDRKNDVVLHGDLHHDNILSSGDDWKAIDPHGYVGDPVFEVGPMIYNPLDGSFPKDKSLSEIVKRRIAILQEELPFDPQRIKDWTFCMALLSAAWTIEGHGNLPEHVIEVAKVIDGTF